ncbi:putative late blight resistance protein homolog R1B-14 isoform X2 [Ipomoea triloba]|uniref:putative late blight resistance protein homolog R1B-14 isoform X2 n=1 Tax=Ipomoea triloba TaxID=35885 RepID=UPI00125DE232|nr:putative late blight resistance protein homolog R1B-14 isoform X2 [Ipomoea triloba]XP_031103885.1 putative late blight resistance protein homolog R1B-14 isoform X2 [Ipomoea triloba]
MKVWLLETIEMLSAKLCILQAFLEERKMWNGWFDDNVAGIYDEYEIKYKLGLVYSEAKCGHLIWTLKEMVREIEEVEEWMLIVKKETGYEGNNIKVWDTYRSALDPEDEVMVGIHSDIETIVNRLCYSHFMRSVFTILRNSNIHKFQKYVENPVLKLQVISLVGEGGIGKTTLAKRVYGNPTTIASFHIRAWVVLSKDAKFKEILIGLLRCISPITSENYDMDYVQIGKQLYKSLMGKKYLIFLDDIWDIVPWIVIQEYFPENLNGSRILVTTRSKEVAEELSANLYNVKHQTLEDHWELFSRKVFGQSHCVPSEYEKIGKRIVRGCGGLPLVVVLTSGLLMTAKGSLEIWRDVARTLDGVGIYDDRISKIVSLSYKYLPSHLKACFYYFCVFPEDSEILVKKLINLWVAEGFIKQHNNMSLEEVGESYLHDLINRSLVQINELSIDGKVKSCNIHDRVHEVCVRQAIDGNTLWIIKDYYAPKACHWLSCQTSHWPITRASYGNCGPDEIHSVLCFGKDVYHSKCRLVYPCLKLLRVLDLSLVKCSQGMPHEITDLVHLRYLALNTIGSLYKFRFFKLKNLVTLIVTSWMEKRHLQLPCDILDLPQLRYLHVDKRCSQFLPCLVKNDLQTLYWLKVSSSDEKPNFRMVPNLMELGIYIEGQLAPSHLGSLVHLHLLEKLKFEVGRVERFCLPTGSPPNLKKLTLCYTYLPWKEMDTIGKLPHLEVLKLKDFAFCGPTWEPSEHDFRELKALLISRSNLKHWNASSINFLVLERLVLSYCWELKQVPINFAKITTLNLIVLECCYSSLVTSAMQISSAKSKALKGKANCPLRVRKVGTKVELPIIESYEEESVKSSEENSVETSKEESVGSSKEESISGFHLILTIQLFVLCVFLLQ